MRVIMPAIFIVVSLLIVTKNSSAQNPPFEWSSSYTIEYVQKAPGDPFKNIYSVSGNKARNESTFLKSNKGPSVTIFDLDKQVVIDLLPDSFYKEESTKDIRNMKIQHKFDTNGTWEKVLSEKLNGVDAIKYKIAYDNPDKFIFVWLSENTNEPLKMTNYDGTWLIEVNKFVPGPVDDTLFTVPAGYQNWDDVPKYSKASNPTTQSYSLWQIVSGEVIKITTGKKGEVVELLKNPELKKIEGTTIPIAPQNSIWESVPDGTYKTLTGQTYIIKDSKILQVLGRNGNDVTE